MSVDVFEELRFGKNIYELPLRVCYYARVSTEHEEQMTSIINQVDYFKRYIQNCSYWRFVGGYVDEGISGKEVWSRKQFVKMIQDGEKGRFDLVLTKSVSRFARNTIDSIYYTNYLLNCGIGVIFLNDNINTFYSDSEFRLTLMASIAQDELRKLSQSVKFGLQQSIRRGVVLGNHNLLGYRKSQGKLIIIEEEACIVREVFSLFLKEKYCYSELAKRINLKYNKQYDSTSIKRILTNCKYKGFYCGRKSEVIDYKSGKRRKISKDNWIVYRDYENVPPIVEEDVWDSVQELIEIRKQKRCYEEREIFYVGKLFCVVHRKVLSHKSKYYKNKTYHYFVCSGCCSFSEKFLDRIKKYCNLDKIWVVPGEVIQLDIKCQ